MNPCHSDIIWSDSRVLWAQHASGTFAQLDIMDAPAPVNSAPRSTVACSPLGMVSFALDVVREREIPFEAEYVYYQSTFSYLFELMLVGRPRTHLLLNTGILANPKSWVMMYFGLRPKTVARSHCMIRMKIP
jgi:hypothetical protein